MSKRVAELVRDCAIWAGALAMAALGAAGSMVWDNQAHRFANLVTFVSILVVALKDVPGLPMLSDAPTAPEVPPNA